MTALKTWADSGAGRALTGAALLLVLLLVSLPAPASAQTRKTAAMREKVYSKLSKAQEATETQDWEEAFDNLDDVGRMKDLSANEKAQLYTAYGYTYFAQEKYAESAEAYEKVLEQEELQEAMRLSTIYTLGQLHFHLEHYEQAAGHLERWLELATNPGPEPYILLGQAYYQLGKLEQAAEPVRRAVAIARERDTKVQENWYALLRVIYFETKDYPRLLEVLEILVRDYPAKEYWLHLSSAYGEMGDSTRQLAAYDMAYQQGYLTRGSEIVLLAQLLLQAEVPFRAGTLLQAGLDDGTIEGNAANWRLLSQAWIMAQEHQKAIASLRRAAELSDDGELHARIAQSFANLGEWQKSADAAQTALDRGVESPGELHLMRGMAFFELGDYGQAKAAFGKAQQSSESRAAAVRWQAFLEREQDRLRQLGMNP